MNAHAVVAFRSTLFSSSRGLDNGVNYIAFDADAFYVAAAHDDDGADEMFAGETIVYSGEEMRVYPIGSGSWIWSEVED